MFLRVNFVDFFYDMSAVAELGAEPPRVGVSYSLLIIINEHDFASVWNTELMPMFFPPLLDGRCGIFTP